jgi:hypothetical protein
MKKCSCIVYGLVIVISIGCSRLSFAQSKVSFKADKNKASIDVLVDNKLFTSFIYPDTLEKPVLYPVNTADGITITRGFPLQTRPGDQTDHPHHIGLWLNYESVNGLDFWNNSYAIPAERKANYGWIRNVKVESFKGGKSKGSLTYSANWENINKKVLLKEQTTFIFSGTTNRRIIDRYTTLTAQQDQVVFKDVKDGFIAIRLTKEMEMPSDKPAEFTDVHGNITKISPRLNGATGNYLSSEGKTGDDVWGTRGVWTVLSGKKDNTAIAVAIIDHPENPGFPTYWHARGYGLFAANPLGQQIFSEGKENLNLILKPGESTTFRYRIVVESKGDLNAAMLNQLADQFSTINNNN